MLESSPGRGTGLSAQQGCLKPVLNINQSATCLKSSFAKANQSTAPSKLSRIRWRTRESWTKCVAFARSRLQHRGPNAKRRTTPGAQSSGGLADIDLRQRLPLD